MLNNILSKVEEFSRVNWARKRAIIEILAIRVPPYRNVSLAQKRRFSTRQACSRWLVGEEHERLVCSSASSITFTLKPVFYANRLAKNRFPPICIAPMPYLKRKYPWNRHKNTFRINVDPRTIIHRFFTHNLFDTEPCDYIRTYPKIRRKPRLIVIFQL